LSLLLVFFFFFDGGLFSPLLNNSWLLTIVYCCLVSFSRGRGGSGAASSLPHYCLFLVSFGFSRGGERSGKGNHSKNLGCCSLLTRCSPECDQQIQIQQNEEEMRRSGVMAWIIAGYGCWLWATISPFHKPPKTLWRMENGLLWALKRLKGLRLKARSCPQVHILHKSARVFFCWSPHFQRLPAISS
jgi:hypothetical protein